MKKVLKIMLGIVLAPIFLVVTILIAFADFISTFAAGLLNILAIIIALLATFANIGFAIMHQWDWTALLLFVVAWLISPYGLPGLLLIIVAGLKVFRDWLLAKVYV